MFERQFHVVDCNNIDYDGVAFDKAALEDGAIASLFETLLCMFSLKYIFIVDRYIRTIYYN